MENRVSLCSQKPSIGPYFATLHINFHVKLWSTAGSHKWSWRKFHYEELRNLNSSPNAILGIKSRIRCKEQCSAHGRHKKCTQDFGHKGWRKENVL